MPDTVTRYTSQEMLERLMAFETVSSESNLALIEFVEDYLRSLGVAGRRTLSDDGRKANFFATLGPEVEGGVVLSGHSDVVPVAGQAWTSPPFQLTRRDGRLFGRGSADMKGFLAIALALAPEILAAGPKKPIHLAFSYDEEVGCLGVGRLIEDVARNLPRPRIVIVGEPTSMQIVNAHKGIYAFRTRITGREAHSSQPHRSANAIMAAAELIAFLGRLAAEKRTTAPPDSPFVPPYTSLSVGTIEGGTALNIVPRHCEFVWEIRPLPGDDAEAMAARLDHFAETEVLPRLRETAPEAEIETERNAAVPPFAPEDGSPAEALLRLLTGANQTQVVSYGTEAGLFQEAGFSAVVCGPGSIDQAHRPDEFIAESQIAACEDFLRKLIAWAASG